MESKRSSGRGFRNRAIGGAILLLFSLSALELVSQIYTRYAIAKLEAGKDRPDHYYTLSANEILGYELARNRTIVNNDKILRINKYGIREDDDILYGQWKIALLGASVVFGDLYSNENTISQLLQAEFEASGREVKVLNFAVPGYGLDEHLENLKIKNDVYDVDHVVFVMNAVDFCRRNSRFEGGDNGLYRMYHPPGLASLFLLRKAIYRYNKGGFIWDPKLVSPEWYEWLYRGNRQRGLAAIKAMNNYCATKGCAFTLFLLPPGSAYVESKFVLMEAYSEIFDFAEANGIEVIQSIEEFSDARVLFDQTDHLTLEGNRRLASILARHLQRGINEHLSDIQENEGTRKQTP